MRAALVATLCVAISITASGDNAGRRGVRAPQCNAATISPNFNYMSYGYHFLRGFPTAKTVDPGYSNQPIFKFTYEQNRCTDDGKYLIPDHWTIRRDMSCTDGAYSADTKGSYNIQSRLTNYASMSGSYRGWFTKASFTASDDFKATSSRARQYSYVTTETHQECLFYRGSIDHFSIAAGNMTLTDDFRAAVRATRFLKLSDVKEFISQFGTHIIEDIQFGSRTGMVSNMRYNAYQTANSIYNKLHVSGSASFHFMFHHGDVSKNEVNTVERNADRYFSRYTENVQEYSYGVPLPVNCVPYGTTDNKCWVEVAQNDTLPVRTTMGNLIGSLFTKKYFPRDPEIDAKRTSMLKFFETEQTCSDLGGCLFSAYNPCCYQTPFQPANAANPHTTVLRCPDGSNVVGPLDGYDGKWYAGCIPLIDINDRCTDLSEFTRHGIVNSTYPEGVPNDSLPSVERVIGRQKQCWPTCEHNIDCRDPSTAPYGSNSTVTLSKVECKPWSGIGGKKTCQYIAWTA